MNKLVDIGLIIGTMLWWAKGKAEVTGSVQGEVKSMSLNYTLKARKVETKIKKKKFGIGFQLGITYINADITPYVVLGVSYNLIRF